MTAEARPGPAFLRTRRVVRSGDPEHPPELAGAVPARRVLRVIGNPACWRLGPRLAVVGTRAPTRAEAERTRRVVERGLASARVVVSGLSPGVDAVAHEAALRRGAPTIAVVAWGFGRAPGGARGALAARIGAAGLLVSAFPDDSEETPARRWWRNRVIAGLCDALVVVASEPDGGAWEAARWAERLGRRVLRPEDV